MQDVELNIHENVVETSGSSIGNPCGHGELEINKINRCEDMEGGDDSADEGCVPCSNYNRNTSGISRTESVRDLKIMRSMRQDPGK